MSCIGFHPMMISPNVLSRGKRFLAKKSRHLSCVITCVRRIKQPDRVRKLHKVLQAAESDILRPYYLPKDREAYMQRKQTDTKKEKDLPKVISDIPVIAVRGLRIFPGGV